MSEPLRIGLAWACVAGILLLGIGTRLQYPDLTETRLFLMFWPRWVLASGLACLAAWCLTLGTPE